MILDPPLISNMWLVLGVLVPVIFGVAVVGLWIERRIEQFVKGRTRRND